jgi:nitrate/nitrite transport system substrate-binding protein
LASTESLIDRAVESAVVRAVFGGNDVARRRFLEVMGRSTFVAALSSVFPLAACKSAVKEELAEGAKEGSAAAAKVADGVEKKSLKVGFVPITCATPIIMAKPMGFYEKHGLDVDVIKTAGWAVARDKSLNGEYDASHMLTPMPLAITMGAGSIATPYLMPSGEAAGQRAGGPVRAGSGSRCRRGDAHARSCRGRRRVERSRRPRRSRVVAETTSLSVVLG